MTLQRFSIFICLMEFWMHALSMVLNLAQTSWASLIPNKEYSTRGIFQVRSVNVIVHYIIFIFSYMFIVILLLSKQN